MNTITVSIPNISCQGCVKAIQAELSELAGVLRVEGDPKTKRVTIAWDERTNWEAIRARLVEIDYPPVDK
jgi:copper chaperone CopZ